MRLIFSDLNYTISCFRVSASLLNDIVLRCLLTRFLKPNYQTTSFHCFIFAKLQLKFSEFLFMGEKYRTLFVDNAKKRYPLLFELLNNTLYRQA